MNTNFGTRKIKKTIGLRFPQFNPQLPQLLQQLFTSEYSVATVVDMSLNSSINQYGYTHVFDYVLEVEGMAATQAMAKERIVVRSTDGLNQTLTPGHIPPRFTWKNDIQQLIIAKTRHQNLIYLMHRDKWEPVGMDDRLRMSGIRTKMLNQHLAKLKLGEAVQCDIHPYDRGFTFHGGFSPFVLDEAPDAVQLPDLCLAQIAMKVFVK